MPRLSASHPLVACAAAFGAMIGLSIAPGDAAAQSRSACGGLAAAPTLVLPAQYMPAPLADEEVGFVYLGHSTFLIESAEGVTIATDYAGRVGRGVVPDVVTMNGAHETHYTDRPDPRIPYVLRGWTESGAPADHELEIDDVFIRNVSTSVKTWGGYQPHGNSIFVFEIAGLCIGHLGHLHFVPNDAQFAEIGYLDVVFVPVDGVYTMSHADVMAVLKQLRARLIVPMHYFGPTTLNAFLTSAQEEFRVEFRQEPVAVVSKATLPSRPTVLVVPPIFEPRDD